MKNINKKGISLIVLIITIIVIIILAAVVILTLSKNNPIESAKEAAFKEDIQAYQDELNMYITKEYQQLAGQRDSKITATGYEKDSTSEEYNNSVYKYLSSFKKKYENKIAIENDEIVYIGRDKKEREWTNNIVKMNPILTVKYVYENGEEAAPTYEETVTDGAYEVDSPIIDGYEPDHYTVSDKIDKDTEITVTYYPWSEGLAYEELTDGTYTVSGIGTFTGENLVIPRKRNGKDVTEIKQNAFYQNTTIKLLVLPETLKDIKGNAFYFCYNLKKINLNAQKIGNQVFEACAEIENVEIGKRVNSIGSRTFWRGSSKLNCIYVYTSIANLNAYTFESNSVKEIKINHNNTKYEVDDGVLLSKDRKKIYMYPIAKEGNYIIPDNVEELGEFSFYNNINIKEIVIPEKVTKIGKECFYSCTHLEYVRINSKNIDSWAFELCTNLKKVEISNDVKTISANVFSRSTNIEEFIYLGTMNEWNNINKASSWKDNSSITKVICTDGEIEL